MRLKPGRGLSVAVTALLAVSRAWVNAATPPPITALTAPQIVARMQLHDSHQNQHLLQYRSLRVYHVEYHGYAAKISAEMTVAVTYNAVTGKSFHIVSHTGSALLCDEVLKRAVTSEEQASKERGATALTPDNYTFSELGTDSLNGRPAYILAVVPVKPNKFQYRGKIWVDAADFAVVKIEAAPAKNPSFWISHTTIWATNEMTNGFWLPEKTRSKTWVRIGGTATLTIDYGTYEIRPSATPAAETRAQSVNTTQTTPPPAPKAPPAPAPQTDARR